jgi:hypothetical protein
MPLSAAIRHRDFSFSPTVVPTNDRAREHPQPKPGSCPVPPPSDTYATTSRPAPSSHPHIHINYGVLPPQAVALCTAADAPLAHCPQRPLHVGDGRTSTQAQRQRREQNSASARQLLDSALWSRSRGVGVRGGHTGIGWEAQKGGEAGSSKSAQPSPTKFGKGDAEAGASANVVAEHQNLRHRSLAKLGDASSNTAAALEPTVSFALVAELCGQGNPSHRTQSCDAESSDGGGCMDPSLALLTGGSFGHSLVPASPDAAAVLPLYRQSALEDGESTAQVVEIALWMRGVLTWQNEAESWKWLGGGVYVILVTRQVAAHASYFNPASLLASAGLCALLGESALSLWPSVQRLFSRPAKVRCRSLIASHATDSCSCQGSLLLQRRAPL